MEYKPDQEAYSRITTHKDRSLITVRRQRRVDVFWGGWGGGALEEVEVDRVGVDDEVEGTEKGRFGKVLEGRVGQPEQRSRRVHHSSTAALKPTNVFVEKRMPIGAGGTDPKK